jgi:bifunctional non-homologous end joining protein LigD
VVQKHAASHLHFDLRLWMGGVMKSWAVPKGPSFDPETRRLAIEVEDHPLEYNTFEGTIPEGEYGGGTVMLWDQGHYTAPDALPGVEEPEALLLEQLRKGRLRIEFRGKRLKGGYSLVRTSRAEGEKKAQWLLIKQEDQYAHRTRDPVEEFTTSVTSGRSMQEIAAGKGGRRVWRSNRAPTLHPQPAPAAAPAPSFSGLLPMKAAAAGDIPRGKEWTYEPKYDGMRVLAFVSRGTVALVTNNGNDKAVSFPEIVDALKTLGASLKRPLVLDGELVALREGEPARFSKLQGRMHVGDPVRARQLAAEEPAAFVGFDLLVDGEDDVLVHEPWRSRRARLEKLLSRRQTERIRLAPSSSDMDELLSWVRTEGWEGIVAKRVDSAYRPATRSQDWRKLKLEHRQEFVVGGWTEPKGSRSHFGSLLLGYYTPAGEFLYAGNAGTGFTQQILAELHRRLVRLERKTSPFKNMPKEGERPHWVSPKLVVEVEFNGWTDTGRLRQTSFEGLRDDKNPRSVVREPPPLESAAPPIKGARRKAVPKPADDRTSLVKSLNTLCRAGEGTLELPEGRLPLTNLQKVYFPRRSQQPPITKGELLRYYLEMSPHILPAMRDRPLVLRRFPNGIRGEVFYQQTAPEQVPEGVRLEAIVNEEGEEALRFVGGSLATLLYTIQLGAISYDPWHSRIGALDSADYTIIDLDPGAGTRFGTVVKVAQAVREELERLGLHAALKTSGKSGLHVYLPLAKGTPLDAARLVAEIVAVQVAQRHSRIATVERAVRRRPKGTVYVDYLQNIQSKTVAGVYAVRAEPGATVSTPLAWEELKEGLDPREFTLRNVPERVRKQGDLWAETMARPNSLERLLPAEAAA